MSLTMVSSSCALESEMLTLRVLYGATMSTIILGALWEGPISGASMNQALSPGSALGTCDCSFSRELGNPIAL